jgi:hypothetical protein
MSDKKMGVLFPCEVHMVGSRSIELLPPPIKVELTADSINTLKLALGDRGAERLVTKLRRMAEVYVLRRKIRVRPT